MLWLIEKFFFDQAGRNNLITYDSIWRIKKGKEDYTSGYLLEYNYFKNYYKMIAIDLSKQQALDADTKAIWQINFNWNLERQSIISFIIEVLDFS